MKVRRIKRKTVARMLSCEVISFAWATYGPVAEPWRRLMNNHCAIIQALRDGLKELA